MCLVLLCCANLLSAQLTAHITPASGLDKANGAIVVSTSFGTQPYTFVWSDPSLSTNEAYNLKPGTYCVTVKDVTNCCSATACFILPYICTQNCLIPAFICDLSQDGCTINFTDISDVPPKGTIRRSWDFGDGTKYSPLDSSSNLSSHSFTTSGCYDVTLSIQYNNMVTSTVKTICCKSSVSDSIKIATFEKIDSLGWYMLTLAKVKYRNYLNLGNYYAQKDPAKALGFYEKGMGALIYSYSNKDDFDFFRNIYLLSALGVIHSIGRDYYKLSTLRFPPSVMEDICPVLSSAMRAAGGTCDICNFENERMQKRFTTGKDKAMSLSEYLQSQKN